MKPLIAITCIAILAMVGYFFFGEYQAHIVRAEADMAEAMARAERARFEVGRSECHDDIKRHAQARTYVDLLPQERLAQCAEYFTDADIQRWRAEAGLL